MRIMLYDTDSQSRNADFISIAPKGETTLYILRVASAPSKCVRCAPQSGNPQPSAAEPLSPPERSDATLLHNPRRSRAPFSSKPAAKPPPPPSGPKGPSNLMLEPGVNRHFEPGEFDQFQPKKNSQQSSAIVNYSKRWSIFVPSKYYNVGFPVRRVILSSPCPR